MLPGTVRLVLGLPCLCGVIGCAEAPPDQRSAGAPATAISRTESGVARLPTSKNAPLAAQQERPPAPRELRPDDWFEDVTTGSGVCFAYHDGNEAGFYTLLEQVGGGAAAFDYDRDGGLDLFFTGGGRLTGPPAEVHGRPCGFFRNQGDWQFTDVTQAAGLGDSSLYTNGCAVGDFDRDGFPDLFVAGYRGCRLYHNLGDGRFADVTQSAGLKCEGWNVTAAWFDYDRDGDLDLYVGTYGQWDPSREPICTSARNMRDSCSPKLYPGDQDRLWHNLGDSTFADVTQAAGLVSGNRALGVVALDLDGDGWQDLFVTNDVEANLLYFGGPQLPFEERALLSGVALSPSGMAEGSMGVDVGDFDGDGEPDLFYANYAEQDNSLLRNIGNRNFQNVSDITRITGSASRWVKFGTGFFDFDGDGWLDLFVNSGHVMYSGETGPYFQPVQLFRNEGGRRFVEVTDQAGPYFSTSHAGRGALVADLDNDGGLDLVFVNQTDPASLQRHRRPPANWVRVQLVGTDSNRDATGTRCVVPFGTRPLTRWIRGGGGYLSHFDSRLLFPLPDDKPAVATVTWPGGRREVFSDLTVRTTHVLVEGRGRQFDASRG